MPPRHCHCKPDCLVINIGHRFQKPGFYKQQLFYTQDDYGLFRCACYHPTCNNEGLARSW